VQKEKPTEQTESKKEALGTMGFWEIRKKRKVGKVRQTEGRQNRPKTGNQILRWGMRQKVFPGNRFEKGEKNRAGGGATTGEKRKSRRLTRLSTSQRGAEKKEKTRPSGCPKNERAQFTKRASGPKGPIATFKRSKKARKRTAKKSQLNTRGKRVRQNGVKEVAPEPRPRHMPQNGKRAGTEECRHKKKKKQTKKNCHSRALAQADQKKKTLKNGVERGQIVFGLGGLEAKSRENVGKR